MSSGRNARLVVSLNVRTREVFDSICQVAEMHDQLSPDSMFLFQPIPKIQLFLGMTKRKAELLYRWRLEIGQNNIFLFRRNWRS